MSLIGNGPYRGMTLHKLIKKLGKTLLGSDIDTIRFPLLVKVIDAAQHLSVQVHPDDRDAALLGSEAKTECWVVLDAAEDAAVYAGFRHGVSENIFKEALKKDALLECLEKIDVQRGDVIYIPGGSIHAILSGCLILEVQQNSNTTYRIYDWGRGRELHLKQAMQVLHFDHIEGLLKTPEVIGSNPKIEKLVTTPYFSIEKIELTSTWSHPVDPRSFEVYFCLSGQGELEVQGHSELYREGMSYLIAAGSEEVSWVCRTKSEIFRITTSVL
jgi:mannose-6-phosphate isomerase